MSFNHSQLVEIGYKWILNHTPCGVAFKELHTAAGETPDVIGFCSNGVSILVECKTSRLDFLSDRKKFFRMYPDHGMGSHRFYCCPAGMIKKEELPEGWGLLYVNDAGKALAVHRNYIGNAGLGKTAFKKNERNEYCMMYSALRRTHVKKFLPEIYNNASDGGNNRG